MSMASEIANRVRVSAFKRRLGERLVMLVSLVLMVLAAIAALVMVQGINQQISDVVHTYEVRNQARELTIALTDAESSQRGYVLTHDDSYLVPYQRAASAIQTRMLSLVAITGDDEAQASRVKDIGSEILAKLAEMERTVELVSAERSGEARTLIQTGMGDRLMDEIRTTLEQFIGEENQKLLDRNRAIDESRRWLVGAIVAALVGAVVLGYSLLARTRQEMSALARSQNRLRSENETLESAVQERTRAVEEAREHAERERQRVEALLQDTNHRIGNSLATVSSLLGLQLLRSKSDEVRLALEAARSRVHAIASAHRRLRLGDDLETASADEFLDAVLEDLASTVGESRDVTLVGQIDPIVISARDATTVGILVGELVTNALKHAFPEDRAGAIRVSLRRDKTGVPVLLVDDNGVGMPLQQEPGESGLGSVIIKQLSSQFGGVAEYSASPGGGLTVHVSLPDLGAALPQG